MTDKESMTRLTQFICPKCGQGRHEPPSSWQEFWREHGPALATDPNWMDKARTWFAARGEAGALDKAAACPVCGSEEHLGKWLVKGPVEAGKTFRG